MNDAGIDRSTAKTNQQQPCQCHCFPKRQKKRRYPNRDDPCPIRTIWVSSNFKVRKPHNARPTVMPTKKRLAKPAAVSGAIPLFSTR